MLAIAAAVVSDAVRRKVLYLIGVFAAILAVMIPQLPTYGAGVVAGVFREISLALVFAASLALVLSLAANRVPAEVERRTVYNVLSKHVRRWEYIAGTWLGISAVMAIAVGAFIAVTQGIGAARYHEPMWQLWQGGLGIWLEMSALAAFAVGVSAVTGPVVVVTAALAFLFAAHSREALVGTAPTGIAAFYPSFDTFNVISPVAHGGGVSPAYMLVMLGVFAAWAGVLLLAASAVFSTRDL
jgi:ABC-type transport system involved in multi-copper enzyme maturation permease subunit